jgi:dimethylglycine dehydrogenase
VFGQKFGWERANWFAPKGVEQIDDWSFRRSNWFDHVGNECLNVQNNVGILDMTAFAKCRISGPGAKDFLDSLVANKLPQKKWKSQSMSCIKYKRRCSFRVYNSKRIR